jgi:hypothetical protein
LVAIYSLSRSESVSLFLNLSLRLDLKSMSFCRYLSIIWKHFTLYRTSFLFVERKLPQSGNPQDYISIASYSNTASSYSRSYGSPELPCPPSFEPLLAIESPSSSFSIIPKMSGTYCEAIFCNLGWEGLEIKPDFLSP